MPVRILTYIYHQLKCSLRDIGRFARKDYKWIILTMVGSFVLMMVRGLYREPILLGLTFWGIALLILASILVVCYVSTRICFVWVFEKLAQKRDICEITIEAKAPSYEVIKTILQLFNQKERVNEISDSAEETATIDIETGVGLLGLNPALVRLHITPISTTSTKVKVCGIAQEGLIKAHHGEKIAKKTAEMLSKVFSSHQTG